MSIYFYRIRNSSTCEQNSASKHKLKSFMFGRGERYDGNGRLNFLNRLDGDKMFSQQNTVTVPFKI
jgi:hypothetical protein